MSRDCKIEEKRMVLLAQLLGLTLTCRPPTVAVWMLTNAFDRPITCTCLASELSGVLPVWVQACVPCAAGLQWTCDS